MFCQFIAYISPWPWQKFKASKQNPMPKALPILTRASFRQYEQGSTTFNNRSLRTDFRMESWKCKFLLRHTRFQCVFHYDYWNLLMPTANIEVDCKLHPWGRCVGLKVLSFPEGLPGVLSTSSSHSRAEDRKLQELEQNMGFVLQTL